MLMTVQQALDALNAVQDKTKPIIAIDCRSGVVDGEIGINEGEFHACDADYGVELPVGTPVVRITIG